MSRRSVISKISLKTFWVGSIVALAGCQAPTVTPAEQTSICESALKDVDDYAGNAGLIQRDLREVSKVLRSNPSNAEAYAISYRLLANLEVPVSKSAPFNQKALDIDPTNQLAQINQGYVYFAQGDMANAHASLAQLDQKWPHHVRVLILKARIAQEEKQYVDAQKAATAAYEATPLLGQKIRALGVLSEIPPSAQDQAYIRSAYEKLIASRPDAVWLKGNYGSFLVNRGFVDEGIDWLKKAAAEGNYGMAHIALAAAYTEKGKVLMWQKNDGAAAKAYFEQAIAENPNNSIAHYGLGSALFSLNQPDAKKEFEQALQLDPQMDEAREALKRF